MENFPVSGDRQKDLQLFVDHIHATRGTRRRQPWIIYVGMDALKEQAEALGVKPGAIGTISEELAWHIIFYSLDENAEAIAVDIARKRAQALQDGLAFYPFIAFGSEGPHNVVEMGVFLRPEITPVTPAPMGSRPN